MTPFGTRRGGVRAEAADKRGLARIRKPESSAEAKQMANAQVGLSKFLIFIRVSPRLFLPLAR